MFITKIENIFKKPPAWKPNNGYCDYFEDFQRLVDKHEMSIWEKVTSM
jgi:hypothetical protein